LPLNLSWLRQRLPALNAPGAHTNPSRAWKQVWRSRLNKRRSPRAFGSRLRPYRKTSGSGCP